MENAKISNLYDLDETIAKEYLEQFTYPWEALKGISEFIKKLGPTLDPEKFEKRGYLGCKECKSGTDSMFKRSADH